jgi:hypothetical protein
MYLANDRLPNQETHKSQLQEHSKHQEKAQHGSHEIIDNLRTYVNR